MELLAVAAFSSVDMNGVEARWQTAVATTSICSTPSLGRITTTGLTIQLQANVDAQGALQVDAGHAPVAASAIHTMLQRNLR